MTRVADERRAVDHERWDVLISLELRRLQRPPWAGITKLNQRPEAIPRRDRHGLSEKPAPRRRATECDERKGLGQAFVVLAAVLANPSQEALRSASRIS